MSNTCLAQRLTIWNNSHGSVLSTIMKETNREMEGTRITLAAQLARGRRNTCDAALVGRVHLKDEDKASAVVVTALLAHYPI